MHDLDALRRKTELIRDDLGECRAQALAVRRGAEPRLDKARRVDGNNDRLPSRRDLHSARREGRTPIARAFGKSRKADAKVAASGAGAFLTFAEAGHVDGLHGHLHRLLVGRLVIFEARGGFVGNLSIRLRRRMSIGSIPKARAALSIRRSIVKVITGRDTPR